MTFIIFVMFISNTIVAGIAYRRSRRLMSIFAMFWAGYTFALFVQRMTS